MAETDNPLAKRGPGRPAQKTAKKDEIKLEAKPEPKPVIEGEAEIGDEDSVTFTGKELKALKALLNKNAEDKDEKFALTLADAMADALSRDRKTPAQKENDRRQQQQMKEQARKARLSKAYEQVYCGHMAGCKGDTPHPYATAIAWHEVHDHLWWGICTGCQREFWPNDADYNYWRRKQSFSNGSYNKGSRAGERGGTVDTNAFIQDAHPESFGKLINATPAIPADIGSNVWNLPTVQTF